MALSIIGRNGRSGQVIIKDERKDGAVLLFVCDAFTSFMAIVDAETKGGRGWIPDADEALVGFDFTQAQAFKFTVDTSALPSGPLSFELDVFLFQLQGAVDEGMSQLALSPSNAADWGFRPEGAVERFSA